MYNKCEEKKTQKRREKCETVKLMMDYFYIIYLKVFKISVKVKLLCFDKNELGTSHEIPMTCFWGFRGMDIVYSWVSDKARDI